MTNTQSTTPKSRKRSSVANDTKIGTDVGVFLKAWIVRRADESGVLPNDVIVAALEEYRGRNALPDELDFLEAMERRAH